MIVDLKDLENEIKMVKGLAKDAGPDGRAMLRSIKQAESLLNKAKLAEAKGDFKKKRRTDKTNPFPSLSLAGQAKRSLKSVFIALYPLYTFLAFSNSSLNQKRNSRGSKISASARNCGK